MVTKASGEPIVPHAASAHRPAGDRCQTPPAHALPEPLPPPAGGDKANCGLIWLQARIVKAALAIEPNLGAVLEWYGGCAIMHMDGQTPHQLVQAGHGWRVLDFLYRLQRDERRQDDGYGEGILPVIESMPFLSAMPTDDENAP